ncbi:MAG: phosphoribosyltransferase [Eubacteriales bacterium]|nr:phosphoribosyltransferase [Eubacteriales bacterium]
MNINTVNISAINHNWQQLERIEEKNNSSTSTMPAYTPLNKISQKQFQTIKNVHFGSADFPKTRHLENILIERFENMTSQDLEREIKTAIARNPLISRKKLLKTIAANTQFANVKSFDLILKEIKKRNLHLVVSDDVGIGSSLAYLLTKRADYDDLSISFVPPQELAAKITKLTRKKLKVETPSADIIKRLKESKSHDYAKERLQTLENVNIVKNIDKSQKSAIILGKFSLEHLVNLAQTSPSDFMAIVQNTVFIHPENIINGVSLFTLTSAGQVVNNALKAQSDENLLNNFIQLTKETAKKQGIDDTPLPDIITIKNPLPPTTAHIAANLAYKHKFYNGSESFDTPMIEILRAFQKNSDIDLFAKNASDEFKFFQNSILKHTNLYTPIKINKALQSIHRQIMEKSDNKPVYYYLPKFSKPKSFNYIMSTYFLLNNIPRERVIRDLSEVDSQDAKIVILDDFIGSGKSVMNLVKKIKAQGFSQNNIIVASIIATSQACEQFDEIADGVIYQKIEQFDIKKCEGFKELKENEKEKISELANKILIGGYDDGQYNFSTFYMTPNNNNNIFLANIAPKFIQSTQGIKISFNTFDNTIVQSSLDNINKEFLIKILNSYKKVNGVLPDNVIRKMIEFFPFESVFLIDILNSYGKDTNNPVPFDIQEYLKYSLENFDPENIKNTGILKNIFDMNSRINIQMSENITNYFNDIFKDNVQKTAAPEIILNFYKNTGDKSTLAPESKDFIQRTLKSLKPENIRNINMLEDILDICNNDKKILPPNILKKTNEVLNNIDNKGLSLELFSLILDLKATNPFIIPEEKIQIWLKETLSHEIKHIPANIEEYCLKNNLPIYNMKEGE